jgi:RNA polymerase sigma-70 factor (ECF subfamily)
VDYFRKLKRQPTIVDSDNNDIFEWIQVADESPEQRVIRHQSHDRMHRMLEQLPSEQREVIVLRHFGDLSFKEIAELTNCSINTALGRMRYGLINLRKMMLEKQIAL